MSGELLACVSFLLSSCILGMGREGYVSFFGVGPCILVVRSGVSSFQDGMVWSFSALSCLFPLACKTEETRHEKEGSKVRKRQEGNEWHSNTAWFLSQTQTQHTHSYESRRLGRKSSLSIPHSVLYCASTDGSSFSYFSHYGGVVGVVLVD